MKKKLVVVCCAIVSLAMIAGVVSSATFGYKAMKKSGEMNTQISQLYEKINEAIPNDKDNAKEDDVKIGEQYTILSTKHISDAYISGDTDDLSEEDKETLDMASDIIKEIIKDDMTDYEKELAVYEWLTMYTNTSGVVVSRPSDAQSVSTPHGVLKTKNAVCVGYATTFRLFMQMLGIECKVVHSTDLSHSWDLVKLDGDWYHTDCYFDAGSANHRGFNMDDNACLEGHEWDREFFPAAAGVKYNYLYLNATDLDDVYKIPAEMKKGFDDQKNTMAFKITDEDSKKMEEKQIIAQAIVDKININIYTVLGKDGYIEYSWTPIDSKTNILGVFIQTYDNGTQDIDPAINKKIIKALEKAFGPGMWEENFEDY